MLLAAKLLADPHRKVYEISAMLGYEDEKYFFKLFKKHYGISPQNFRANIDRKIRKGPDSAEPDSEEKK